MRYIADSNGYVKEVSFGADIECGGVWCTEYTGEIPSGYDSLADWFTAECNSLYRWKITDGNLTLDSDATEPEEVKSDFIVETGSEGIWSWRKWNSGYVELDGKKELYSTTYLNQSGNIYFAYLGAVTFPFELAEITTISFGFIPTKSNAWHWGEGVTTTGITNSYIGRGNSTAVAGYPTFHITGKWK